MEPDLESLLDELRILAQVGLEYTDDSYDEERYERILELVSQWYGESYDLPPETVRSRFADEVGHVTPKVSADAAVFDDDNRILLQKRADDGSWCLPGGYTAPNESPTETAVRETQEETGLVVEPRELVDVYTRTAGEFGPHSLVIHVYRCTATSGRIETSREGDDVRFWELDSVPTWHKDHEMHAHDAYAAHRRKNADEQPGEEFGPQN